MYNEIVAYLQNTSLKNKRESKFDYTIESQIKWPHSI
jgi:hypothetical protein